MYSFDFAARKEPVCSWGGSGLLGGERAPFSVMPPSAGAFNFLKWLLLGMAVWPDAPSPWEIQRVLRSPWPASGWSRARMSAICAKTSVSRVSETKYVMWGRSITQRSTYLQRTYCSAGAKWGRETRPRPPSARKHHDSLPSGGHWPGGVFTRDVPLLALARAVSPIILLPATVSPAGVEGRLVGEPDSLPRPRGLPGQPSLRFFGKVQAFAPFFFGPSRGPSLIWAV